jgi:thiol:disulfide interchange protein DsbD
MGTLLLTAAFWGLISLITPCVFPMIPITVSLFLKQSNQSVGGAVKLAGVYCLTIIVVLGLSAITLLSTFRALSVNPWMNIALGLLFIVLAFSLFGMFDITLPGFMLRYAEGKRKTGGMVGAVFGAIAFSIVSFTCVAPFLGGFAGMASSGQYSQFELVLAGLAFAAAFASPFFVLALFPSLIKKLPKSGGWLDTVKAVMGFLEVAAAIKFFRTAELRLLDKPSYFTYDLALAGFVVTMLACGLYLLNVYRLPHDEEKPTIGVPRLLFAMLFIGLSLYLAPGMLKGQRPRGVVFGWVDAFLLPEPDVHGAELPWRTDLPDALDYARQNQTLVFVDFTGVTCTNCKDNEQNVFPEMSKLLKKYTLVQMYTDEVPAVVYSNPPESVSRNREARANLVFQLDLFGTEQLPLYVILEPQPNGKARVVDVYKEGKINDRNAFREFLQKPLAGR